MKLCLGVQKIHLTANAEYTETEVFSRASKTSVASTAQRSRADHTSSVLSIQQASYNLQICLHYVVLNDMYLDCRVNVVVPKFISNSSV